MLDEHIIRPQTTGDLIGRAIRVYRVNLMQWAPLLLFPTLLAVLGQAVIQATSALTQKNNDIGQLIPALLGMLLSFVVMLIGYWILLLRQLAFVRLANGFSDNLNDALAYVKKRQLTIFGICLLGTFILFAVVVLWFLELIAAAVLIKFFAALSTLAMIFGLIGLMVSAMFVVYALTISLAALACEGGDAAALLSRGFSMGSKCFFRTMYIGFVLNIILRLLTTPLWLPIAIFFVIDAVRLGTDFSGLAATQPIYWQVIATAWQTLIEMVTWPIMFLAFGYYYYDLRLRFEGVDVLAQLDQLKLKNLE